MTAASPSIPFQTPPGLSEWREFAIDGLMTPERFERPGGPNMEADEMQRIARLVELNRQKMTRIEDQISKLTEIRLEQVGVVAALNSLSSDKRTMIPLGSGIQLPTKQDGDTVVVDIGSGIQAERTRTEAIEILEKRMAELDDVLKILQTEGTETENTINELVTVFTEAAAALQAVETPQPESDVTETKPKPRRHRGGELTLDD
jgi:prefoldin alpha subunit